MLTAIIRKIWAFFFLICSVLVFLQCARRGSPSGGPKDEDPPVLIRAEPENMTINFDSDRIRLYFDEYVKLEDVQEQLIVSPPLKYLPEITPQGGAEKYVELRFKDTLQENTTYTLNFGQSIVDNNEGNPNSFLTYVFSTGDYLDSLTVSGAVKDGFNRNVDQFVSVMLYELDTAYTDSTIYQKPPNYITNTLDSAVIFTLRNLKAGKYKLFAVKDEGKNNVFDQNSDKIAFIQDTVTLPTDSTYLLTLFKEIPDYGIAVPSFVSRNKIIFGYYGEGNTIEIVPLTPIPDSVSTKVLKERGKDTLNFWFTPYEMDSLVFTVTNERLQLVDTFTVKSRKVGIDSLTLNPSQRGTLSFNEPFYLTANTPLSAVDTSRVRMVKQDSIPLGFSMELDSVDNQVAINFEVLPEETYSIDLLPGAITDFFETTHDTLNYRLSTKRLADFGNLQLNIIADSLAYPLLVQLTSEKGETKREIYAEAPQLFEFSALEPSNYLVRVVFDANGNRKWDTGNYLRKKQPEKVSYYPDVIEVRANWELEQTFILSE